MKKIKVEITGMTCEHCAVSIEKLLKSKEGIIDVKVNWKEVKGEIKLNPDKINQDDILGIINSTKNYRVKSTQ